MRFPTGVELQRTIEEWELKCGLPGIVGAIDGSHIPIEEPFSHHWEYFNFKGYYSMVLHGMVNARGKFIHVNCSWPGRVGDARIFENSVIYQNADQLFPPNSYKNIRPYLIGDSAYALEEFLMKAYENPMTLPELEFNRIFKKSRCEVERAFGRLKERWRLLRTKLEHNVERIPLIIFVCCLLQTHLRDSLEIAISLHQIAIFLGAKL
jgi:hypothetical protein